MKKRDIKPSGTNALRGGRPLEMRIEVTSAASPSVVYATLADLRSHLEWAGERQSPSARLLTMNAPDGPATVGTEFSSTGSDAMGSFSDRSVVTEAVAGRVFEFVTESRLTPKKGGEMVDWAIVTRYEIAPDPAGSRIVYVERIISVNRLPGMMRLFRSPLVGMIMKVSAKVSRRSLKNLAAVAEERSPAAA